MEVLLTQGDLAVEEYLAPHRWNLIDRRELPSCSRFARINSELSYSLDSDEGFSCRFAFFDRRDRVGVMKGNAAQVRKPLQEHVS